MTVTRDTTPCDLVRSQLLCVKNILQIRHMNNGVSELYSWRSKSWRLTNHSAMIVMLGLQNGFWLANLWGRKSLSCIDFLLNKVKQKAVHILVENYFTYCIPNYFLDTCTKKTSKRMKTTVIKLEIKLNKRCSLSLLFKLPYSKYLFEYVLKKLRHLV